LNDFGHSNRVILRESDWLQMGVLPLEPVRASGNA